MLKEIARTMVRQMVNCAPQGVREAMLEACFQKMGDWWVATRLLPRIGIAEVGVWGDLGLIRGSPNDGVMLPLYARGGTAESDIVSEMISYFGDDSGTYIDVGANIGLTTIPLARNPLIHCLAIEPEPSSFRFLKINVETNAKGSSVEFYQNAIYQCRSKVHLAVSGWNMGDHRLTTDGIHDRQTIEVPALPLDDFMDKVSGKLAVKIDTQGAEPFVVAGGHEVLRRAGLVALEFCPYLMRQIGGDPEIVIELVGNFDEVALIEAGSREKPVFRSALSAQKDLRAKVKLARDSDEDYADILVKRRSPARA